LYFDIEDLCIVNFVNFLDELILKYIKHFLADDVHFLLDFLVVLSDQVQVLGALILFLVLDCLDRVPGCSVRAIVIVLGYWQKIALLWVQLALRILQIDIICRLLR
jgi:hypothetical protein